VYSVAWMSVMWAAVGITLGWILASAHEYRDPAKMDEYAGVHRVTAEEATRALQPFVQAPDVRAVAHATVPGMSRVSVALVAPYVGVCHPHVERTRIHRHRSGLTGHSRVWDTDGKGLMLAIR
jgi:hypothetical protein